MISAFNVSMSTLFVRYKVPPEVLDFDYAGDCRADPMAVYALALRQTTCHFFCHVFMRCCIRYPLFRAWFRAEALSRHVGGTAPDFRAVVGMMCGEFRRAGREAGRGIRGGNTEELGSCERSAR